MPPALPPLRPGAENKDLRLRVTDGNRSLLARGCFGPFFRTQT
jgi:hypothetical protein